MRPALPIILEDILILVHDPGVAPVINVDSDGAAGNLLPAAAISPIDAVPACLHVGADDPELSTADSDVLGGAIISLPLDVEHFIGWLRIATSAGLRTPAVHHSGRSSVFLAVAIRESV